MSAPIATGNTQVLGIIGHPIGQVRAPEVWSALFRANGLDAVCVPMHVLPENLDEFLAAAVTLQNLTGLIVTIPHKPAALASVKNPTERARLTGAVNALRREPDGSWSGDALDGVGFVAALAADGHSVKGLKTLVVGCGGVGTSIAIAIADSGAARVDVSDVSQERAHDLSGRIRSMGLASKTAQPVAAGYDLVVNASPLGMADDDPQPIDLSGVTPSTIVGDVVVHPPMTKLLTAAAAIGCHVQPGYKMMDAQLGQLAAFFGYDGGDWSPEAVKEALA